MVVCIPIYIYNYNIKFLFHIIINLCHIYTFYKKNRDLSSNLLTSIPNDIQYRNLSELYYL